MAGNGRRISDEEPITLAVENLRVGRGGVYHIDVPSLMRGDPLVIKLSEGVYKVDLSPSPRIS